MSDQYQQQQQIRIIDAQPPSEQSERIKATFDDLESKQLDTLDEAGKNLIERIATFLGVLFGISILSNNFPPPYLKHNTSAKITVIVSLVFFLLSIFAGIWATQVRPYSRYRHNMSKNERELKRMIEHRVFWLRVANLLFALGTIALAALLIIVVWSL